MKHKRILAMLLAVASCLSLAVSASAASTARKATDFKDFDRNAWYADAVSAAVDNGLLYGKSSSIIDPNGAMTRAEMAAIINRSFGCYVKADISKYTDVSKSKWYYLKMTRREILTTSGHVSNQQALQKAHAEYDKYKKQQDLRLSPVEQSFLDSVEQLERLEDQAH